VARLVQHTINVNYFDYVLLTLIIQIFQNFSKIIQCVWCVCCVCCVLRGLGRCVVLEDVLVVTVDAKTSCIYIYETFPRYSM
jgi:hypothetical protein